jgi:hypothetical protein
VFCTIWCLSKSYAHTYNCKNKITYCEKKKGKKKEKTVKKNTIAKKKEKAVKKNTIAKSRD